MRTITKCMPINGNHLDELADVLLNQRIRTENQHQTERTSAADRQRYVTIRFTFTGQEAQKSGYFRKIELREIIFGAEIDAHQEKMIMLLYMVGTDSPQCVFRRAYQVSSSEMVDSAADNSPIH